MPKFTPEFLDELKTRIRPSDVIGRHVKLRKQGSEWAGLSPFTKEKTPSFFVNDQKGFYHCFSSGKHGDVIGFLMDTQNLSFIEAVTVLAGEAGLAIPEDDERHTRNEQKLARLEEACEAAAKYFASLLHRAEGRQALEYLTNRGVTQSQIEFFSIGFAADTKTNLKHYLINKGFDDHLLVEAGLLFKPEDGGPSFDRFRGRVMFPILNAKGRVIAFGGRALSNAVRAKYLNSPETPIFHKSNVLYNLSNARTGAQKAGQPLVVCEGYMDVVSLWGAGIETAVAPLGTALTDAQLALMWRVSDEPILCFDGDKAGTNAAYRTVDRALPNLKPGKSLQFAFLPAGKDPDDVVREGGRAAIDQALQTLTPLVEVLWARETVESFDQTPEKRAKLRSRLRELVTTISDRDVREAYGAYLLDKLEQSTRRNNKPANNARAQSSSNDYWERSRLDRRNPRQQPATTRIVQRAVPGGWRREATLVLALINHPSLFETYEAEVLSLELADELLKMLLQSATSVVFSAAALDSAELKDHLRKGTAAETLERILTDETLNRQKFLQPQAEQNEVNAGWLAALRYHVISSGVTNEMARSAAQTLSDDEEVWKAAVSAREELLNSSPTKNANLGETDVSSDEVAQRLERMRQSIRDKFKRNS